MPNDANGKPLSAGDKVSIPATVRSIITTGDLYCNIELELDYVMPPYTEKQIISFINSKQVVKADVQG